jgi:hypothetical protein
MSRGIGTAPQEAVQHRRLIPAGSSPGSGHGRGTLNGVARIVTLVKWTVVAALVTLGLFYAVEDLRIRRAANAFPGSQVETLTFYYSTRLKNGRVQVYYDQPQTEVCVRAVFPHAGRRPCWYARREPVRLVS